MRAPPPDFKQWFLSLTLEERARYAQRAGTRPGYIRVHLIGRRKIPRAGLMERLAQASDGRFSVSDLLAFFYDTGTPLARSTHRPEASA